METKGICIDTDQLSYMRQEHRGASLKVYLYLLSRLDRDLGYPPVIRFDLEYRNKLTTKAVTQAIKELEALGFIRVVRSPGCNNLYYFPQDLIYDEEEVSHE